MQTLHRVRGHVMQSRRMRRAPACYIATSSSSSSSSPSSSLVLSVALTTKSYAEALQKAYGTRRFICLIITLVDLRYLSDQHDKFRTSRSNYCDYNTATAIPSPTCFTKPKNPFCHRTTRVLVPHDYETLSTLLLKLGWHERHTSRLWCGRQDKHAAVCRSAGGRHVLITIVKA